MKLPWVSREAYEERGRRVATLEKHIEALNTLVLPQNSPLTYTVEDGAVDLPIVTLKDDPDEAAEFEEIERERSRVMAGEF